MTDHTPQEEEFVLDPITDESDDAYRAFYVHTMYDRGNRNLTTLAALVERTEEWVRNELEFVGIKPREKRDSIFTRLSDEEKDDIVTRYTNEEAVSSICADYGFKHASLYGILESMGVPVRKRDPATRIVREGMKQLAIEMYEEGWVLWHIEEETGLLAPNILAFARRAGCKMRGKGNRGIVPQGRE